MMIIASGVLRSAIILRGVPTTSGSLHEQRKSGNPSTTPTEPGFRKSVRMRTSFSEPQNVTSPQLQKRRLKTTT